MKTFDLIKQRSADSARERMLFIHRIEGADMMLAVGQAATARAWKESGEAEKSEKILAKGERYFSDTPEHQHIWTLAVTEVESAEID